MEANDGPGLGDRRGGERFRALLGECCEASRHQRATRGTIALVEGTFTSPTLLDA